MVLIAHTPTIGIKEEDLNEADDFATVREELLSLLPSNCVLVGQGIQKGERLCCDIVTLRHIDVAYTTTDIAWMQLQLGVHYDEFIDISTMFRVKAPPSVPFRYMTFSLRHECIHLLSEDIQVCCRKGRMDVLLRRRPEQEGHHDPVKDALWSIKLFRKYCTASEAHLDMVDAFLSSLFPALMSRHLRRRGKHSCERREHLPSHSWCVCLLFVRWRGLT